MKLYKTLTSEKTAIIEQVMNEQVVIKESGNTDLKAILNVNKLAFGSDIEATLVQNLLNDKSAQPILSLLASINNQAIGHILYTKAQLTDQPEISVYILAPMAVMPNFQNRGIGSKLIQKGLNKLKSWNVDLVFVLGHINYYPKNGFINNAEKFNFYPPYPIPENAKDAWMVLELTDGFAEKYSGTVICANELMKKEYWTESE